MKPIKINDNYKTFLQIGALAALVSIASTLKTIYSSSYSESVDKKKSENTISINTNNEQEIWLQIYNFVSNITSPIDNITTGNFDNIKLPGEKKIKSSYNSSIETIEDVVRRDTLNPKDNINEKRKRPFKNAFAGIAGLFKVSESGYNIKSNTLDTDTLENIASAQNIHQGYKMNGTERTINNTEKQRKRSNSSSSTSIYQKNYQEIEFENVLDRVLQAKNVKSPLVDYYLLKATAWQESRFDSRARSSTKATGYFQIVNSTYLKYNPGGTFPDDAYNPEKNTSTAIDHYDFLMKYIEDNHPNFRSLSDEEVIKLAIVGYTSGEGTFTHYYVDYYLNGKKRQRAVLKPENERWKIEFMPKAGRDHLDLVYPKIEYFKEKDRLTGHIPRSESRNNSITSLF